MTPKAVYWDMDGTLIDSEPLHLESLIFGLKSLGIAPPPDLHQRVLGVAAMPVYEMLRDEFGLQLCFEEWIPRKYTHYLENAPRLQARPGALEIFRDLKAQRRGPGRGVELRPHGGQCQHGGAGTARGRHALDRAQRRAHRQAGPRTLSARRVADRDRSRRNAW